MKTVLIIYTIYSSTFFKVGHSSMSVETFDTYEECLYTKSAAVKIVKVNSKIENIIADCKVLPSEE